MEKVVRPEKFDVAPNSPNATKHWKLWVRGFKYFLTLLTDQNPDKLELLFLHIGTNVADIIQDATTYDAAIDLLEQAYVKPVNEVYARHLLSSRAQKNDENIDNFLVIEYFG